MHGLHFVASTAVAVGLQIILKRRILGPGCSLLANAPRIESVPSPLAGSPTYPFAHHPRNRGRLCTQISSILDSLLDEGKSQGAAHSSRPDRRTPCGRSTYGTIPEEMRDGPLLLESLGASSVDINMGLCADLQRTAALVDDGRSRQRADWSAQCVNAVNYRHRQNATGLGPMEKTLPRPTSPARWRMSVSPRIVCAWSHAATRFQRFGEFAAFVPLSMHFLRGIA